jgi:hypothetical protein
MEGRECTHSADRGRAVWREWVRGREVCNIFEELIDVIFL